ncbi:DUF6082 family protein [Paractinoplanes hotanensis]|uniref:DUF6082 family protein n=1 Tax=Paractinoplanes hotanensis TaxID=2906497 RepID=A0ABT0Y8R8_9ACTN|nr:DUF6082 family protein [Actinoplanes hotanensis]MCM4082436.1 DUF6082 family protein [Actinoplanes hotanensis]
MKGDESARAFPWVRWTLFTLLIGGLMVPTGIGLAAAVSRRGDDDLWARWGSAGEAFGAINSLLSAFALAALVITYRTQSRDLRVQRVALEDAEKALRRTADVGVRGLHMELMNMALDDAALADVLPNHGGQDEKSRRQHIYSNLLLQNVWLQYTVGIASEEEMVSNVRHLFASPKVRDYWGATTTTRNNVYVQGTQEQTLAKVADAIWREYQSVLACSVDTPSRDPGDPPSKVTKRGDPCGPPQVSLD